MDISGLAASTPSRSSTALSHLTGNLDSFLTLLTTQLKNQDPLDPLDTEKFTSQLVQFASVEQSIQTNTHLETLIGLQAATERDGALTMIGKTVLIETDKAALGDAGAAWSYELPQGAAAVRLLIVNDKGQPVAQFTGDPGAGAHPFKWDGRQSDGGIAPAGIYRMIVDAKDAAGTAAPFVLQSALRVTGVTFGASGPLLETGVGALPLAVVKRVIEG
jgi:flagellar basal-body rod modification protein FlgD